MASMSYPLLFEYNEILSGFGCPIRITLKGRALATNEGEDDWWISGVNPGAVAGSGGTLQEAFTDFRLRIKAVCIDFLVEARDFDHFRREVERFFHEREENSAREWETAREAVRAGSAPLPALELERNPPQPSVDVRCVSRAQDNVIDSEPAMAA